MIHPGRHGVRPILIRADPALVPKDDCDFGELGRTLQLVPRLRHALSDDTRGLDVIARRGRTIFTPSNISEVRLRFERILARTEDKVDPEIPEPDAATPAPARVEADRARRNPDRAQPVRAPSATGSRVARGARRARLTLAQLYLELRARALEEDERRRRSDRRAPRMGDSHADGQNRTRQQPADGRS